MRVCMVLDLIARATSDIARARARDTLEMMWFFKARCVLQVLQVYSCPER